ncbi:hypothetical protein GWI33_003228 [Rhynchophorus ferrugineus]|uniref:DNA-directed RNA polymerase subunit n=1 Tax=Rhynchophorus ferrugineus TaxID=354439 RepID=A0A834IR29_RHYFE|nr:hypothetical protein GWI33_003228 [Rhynchophorus ferrugineus]
MAKLNRTPKHINPDGLTFSVFTKQEVEKLGIFRIVTPITLDALGHPIVGGLYDIRLGPSTDKNEPCGSCGENTFSCPGHFAYIDLGVPCINPVFHKVVGTILKYSCLTCFRLQLNEESRTKIQYIRETDFENYHNAVVQRILEEVKQNKLCCFCKNSMRKIQVLKNKILLVSRKLDTDKKSKDSGINTLESEYINPADAKRYLQEIWKKEEELIRIIVPVLDDVDCDFPTDIFFFEVIPVPPPNVRPLNYLHGRVLENPQTGVYKNIITNSLVMNQLLKVIKKNGDLDVLNSKAAREYFEAAKGNSALEKLNNCWEELQLDVNNLLSRESRRLKDGSGLKEIIEKKQGVIRQNMMGKRVNFAARSVITPDPNLDVDEVGIPEVFAKKLTYPVPVTPWNVQHLRQLVKNGPNVYPGAVYVEMEDGSVKKINPSNKIQQESLLKILLTPHNERKPGFQGVKIVHRHLQNGDILLLNRQPTLHKPSIMGHKARILKGEKTLRLHYANCKAYNADFDGDEMNAHFPQDEVARSEGYNLAEVAQQYLVPKDGTPLSGLIQDHMIAGVRLSIRGRFFRRSDYQQLVFQALSHKMDEITLLPPAIQKPVALWSGKQILSTVIINIIPKGKALINLTASSKIPAKAWQQQPARKWKAGGTQFENSNNMTEAEVVIRNGELLNGILDKTHYGATPYGLVHCVYELYGGKCAIRLLSSLAKLFTSFLQQEGFTLGVEDILTVTSADAERKKIIKDSRKIGKEAVTKALEIPMDTSLEEVVEKLEERCAIDSKFRQIVDRSYKTSLDSYTNAINKCCLPAGLICKFPKNNLQLMVQSGAKGSTVNTMQISCLLGQIELEGKRPPIMISGKSLPSFPAFEFAPRAGGFIDGRFMTGIQPQEFFFHCMAGREGLIDTAVKTSRSGYLQRCLIKHLEGLHVGYDLTVRNSDQKVIQYFYGEDGMDIFKAQFLNEKQLGFLSENTKCIVDKDVLKQLKSDEDQESVRQYQEKLHEWIENNGPPSKTERKSPFLHFSQRIVEKTGNVSKNKIMKYWKKADASLKQSLKNTITRCPDPINSVFQPDHHFGAVNERLEALMAKYGEGKSKKEKREFENMFKLKGMQSLCAPGEPVGLIAAQSVGEPSTQMTLNTFHFAGRGEMNVTLGIPRLREILMMASKNIKTPSMEIPFKDVPGLEERALQLKKRLTRVVVADVLEKIDVSVKLALLPLRQHCYTLKFYFLPDECYKQEYLTSTKSILSHMRKRFFKEMFMAIAKQSKIKSNLVTTDDAKKIGEGAKRTEDSEDETEEKPPASNTNNDNDSSDEEVEDDEDAKLARKYDEQQENQEPEEGEEQMDVESDEEDDTNDLENSKASQQNNVDETVLDNYTFANSYKEDRKNYFCELVFSLPLNYKKLDLTAILRDVAGKSIIWETSNIKRAITYMKDQEFTLRTDGINIVEMFKYQDLLDLNRLYCNDIHKVAQTYGIEAASKIIVKEVKDVFNVYGIKVDPRHLSLIADYMTFNGIFEPLSRKGMENSTSPLQQMSFEASLGFLKAATIKAKTDELTNPSSCLMLGKPCNTGTGAFSLLQKTPSLTV